MIFFFLHVWHAICGNLFPSLKDSFRITTDFSYCYKNGHKKTDPHKILPF